MHSGKTAPFDLPGGPDAFLLLHGFTGSPWDLRPLGEALSRLGYAVRAIRLPGHGRDPQALTRVSHLDWERASEEALASMSGHRRVFLAGLSMGALLSILLAARHPQRVDGLALIAPAMRFQDPALKIVEALGAVRALTYVWPMLGKSATDIEDRAARAEAPLLRAFPTARLLDLRALQDRVRPALAQVRAPALIAAAAQDHVVELEGARELARGLTAARPLRFIQLSRGFHIIPRDRDQALLFAEMADFFQRVRS